MSLWHRSQVLLVMKKFAGMIPFTFVFADEGKNGLDGPAPSPSMLSAGDAGLAIRSACRSAARCFITNALDHTAAASSSTTANACAGRNRRRTSGPDLIAATVSARTVPALTTAMCDRSSQRYRVVAPV